MLRRVSTRQEIRSTREKPEFDGTCFRLALVNESCEVEHLECLAESFQTLSLARRKASMINRRGKEIVAVVEIGKPMRVPSVRVSLSDGTGICELVEYRPARLVQ